MPKKDRCPKCGVKKSPGYNLCFTCGYRFFGEPQHKILPKDNSHEKMFPAISELLQNKEPSKSPGKCPQCQGDLPTGAKFCVTCGKKVEDKQTTPLIQEKKEEIPTRSCPKCGEELLKGAKFCFTCGKKVEELEPKSLVSEIIKEEPEITSGSESQPISSVSEIKNEDLKTIPPPESQQIPPVPEIRIEDTKISSPPGPRFISPVSETNKEIPAVITTENLTSIPPVVAVETKKPKLKPIFCNFCGIRIPKKTPFCLQCGMIIKVR